MNYVFLCEFEELRSPKRTARDQVLPREHHKSTGEIKATSHSRCSAAGRRRAWQRDPDTA